MESRIGVGLKRKVSKPVSAKKRAMKLEGQEKKRRRKRRRRRRKGGFEWRGEGCEGNWRRER